MSVELPQRLSDRAYLLAYDPARGRVTGWSQRGQVVNAAVLIELWLDGRLTDEQKRAAVVLAAGVPTADRRRPERPLAPLEAAVLERIGRSGPRRWKHWVRAAARDTEQGVRQRLVDNRVVRVEDRSVLGVIRWHRVTVRDPRLAKELKARCRRSVLDGGPLDRVDPLDAALVALVAAAEWNTVFSGRERRRHRDRIAQLALRSGPAAKALRDVVSDDQASA